MILLLIQLVWLDITDRVGDLLELPLGHLGGLCNPACILEGLKGRGQLLKLIRIELMNEICLGSHISQHHYLLLAIRQSLTLYLKAWRQVQIH